MTWTDFDTMEGEGAMSGDWKILRRRGDHIFNVFYGRTVVALAFSNLLEAIYYVQRKQK